MNKINCLYRKRTGIILLFFLVSFTFGQDIPKKVRILTLSKNHSNFLKIIDPFRSTITLENASTVRYLQYGDSPSQADLIIWYNQDGSINEVYNNKKFQDTAINGYFISTMEREGKTFYFSTELPGKFDLSKRGLHLSYNPQTNFLFKENVDPSKKKEIETGKYYQLHLDQSDTTWVLPQPVEEGDEEPVMRRVIVPIYNHIYVTNNPDTSLDMQVEDAAELLDRHFYGTNDILHYAENLRVRHLVFKDLKTGKIETTTVYIPPKMKQTFPSGTFYTTGQNESLVPIEIKDIKSDSKVAKGFVTKSDSSRINQLLTSNNPLNKVKAVDKNDVPIDMWTDEKTDETFTSDQKGKQQNQKWNPGKISIIAASVAGGILWYSFR